MPKTTDIFYVSGDSHTASPRRLLALLSCSHIASAFARIPPPQGISANANSPHDHGHQIVFKTDVPGDIVLEIHRSWAPIGVERVIDLVSPLNGHRFDRLLDGRLREAGPLCTLSSSLPQTEHECIVSATSGLAPACTTFFLPTNKTPTHARFEMYTLQPTHNV